MWLNTPLFLPPEGPSPSWGGGFWGQKALLGKLVTSDAFRYRTHNSLERAQSPQLPRPKTAVDLTGQLNNMQPQGLNNDFSLKPFLWSLGYLVNIFFVFYYYGESYFSLLIKYCAIRLNFSRNNLLMYVNMKCTSLYRQIHVLSRCFASANLGTSPFHQWGWWWIVNEMLGNLITYKKRSSTSCGIYIMKNGLDLKLD